MYNFQLSEKEIIKIHNSLKSPDGIIAFPTDTVWGVGCLIENELAVNRIYSTKGRSEIKPLILLGSKIEYLVPYVAEIPEVAGKIIDKYLPGAVTLVLQKSDKTPSYLTSGGNTVGIRIPNCPPFLSLLDNAIESHVLATTSANLSGEPAALSKSEIENKLGDKVDYILDDYGYSAKGTESTVVLVDPSGNIKILRQGAVAIDV
ncbi:MAG: hypothetical protein ACD_20C00411G0011 [uncultured bacterium]|nr:MAG: hypothetical protein ACD_20C00411G0011 [uncultured bacterium]